MDGGACYDRWPLRQPKVQKKLGLSSGAQGLMEAPWDAALEKDRGRGEGVWPTGCSLHRSLHHSREQQTTPALPSPLGVFPRQLMRFPKQPCLQGFVHSGLSGESTPTHGPLTIQELPYELGPGPPQSDKPVTCLLERKPPPASAGRDHLQSSQCFLSFLASLTLALLFLTFGRGHLHDGDLAWSTSHSMPSRKKTM